MRRVLLRFAPLSLATCFIILAFPSVMRAQNDAAKLFKANCALCHGADGSGNTPTGKAMKAKDLKSDEVQKQTDAALTEVISKGRNKMPAFGSKFSPDVISSLVVYIRQIAKK